MLFAAAGTPGTLIDDNLVFYTLFQHYLSHTEMMEGW